MDEQGNCEKIFGPYNIYPRVYVSYSDSKPTLKRKIFDEEPEVQVQQPKNEDADSMTWKQFFLYYLFLYTPSKEPKPQLKSIKEKTLGEEVLCEFASGFDIVQKPDGYYVHSKIRNP